MFLPMGVGVGKRIFGAIRAIYKTSKARGKQMKWEWFCLPKQPEANTMSARTKLVNQIIREIN